MIPKIIHFIWLGSRPLDKLSKKCIASWRRVLPDYKIVKWGDEKCVDIINGNKYAKQAYEKKKFAFVSDYIRVYVLYHYGGIYMDTDVQVFKPLDRFLNDGAFSSFESYERISTALMASEKGNLWMKMLLDDYEEREFIRKDGSMDLKTNVSTITELSLLWGLKQNNKEQVLNSSVHIYPKEFFCPIDTMNRKNDCFTNNTYAVHLFNGSWQSPLRRRLSKLKKKLGIDPRRIFGKRIHGLLKKI